MNNDYKSHAKDSKYQAGHVEEAKNTGSVSPNARGATQVTGVTGRPDPGSIKLASMTMGKAPKKMG